MRSLNKLTLKEELSLINEDLVSVHADTIAIIKLIANKFNKYFSRDWEYYIATLQVAEMSDTYHSNWTYGYLADTLYIMKSDFNRLLTEYDYGYSYIINGHYQYYCFLQYCKKHLSGLVPQGWIDFVFGLGPKAIADEISSIKKYYWYD